MKKINAGIMGGAGYTAGELIRLLIHHPHVQLQWVQSDSQAGLLITQIHNDLTGESTLTFVKDVNDADVIFLCKGHGESKKFLEENPLNSKVIDLSQDFRLKGDHGFVYGLPEFFKEDISKAQNIANPGCFATALQLSLLPAVRQNLPKGDFHVSGLTGSTGAGQKLSGTSHFSWRYGNASAYKVLTHQHLLETSESARRINPSHVPEIHFVPYRGAFTRGIITTTYFHSDMAEKDLVELYKETYDAEPFTHITDQNPDLKMVLNTNKAILNIHKAGSQAVIICVIDNLLKGASGQAVQNMNLISGLPEHTGLNLKPSAF